MFKAHQVLHCNDEPTLYLYLQRYRKRWNDQAHRHRLTEDEARSLFST